MKQEEEEEEEKREERNAGNNDQQKEMAGGLWYFWITPNYFFAPYWAYLAIFDHRYEFMSNNFSSIL